jgi:Spy/CpxP family protein refolding chaperone
MKYKKINRWFVATAITGSVMIGGAYLVMPAAAAQEATDDSSMRDRKSRRGRRGKASEFERWRMMRELDLTEEQQEMFKELRKTQLEQTKDEREALRSAEKQFREAIKSFENGDVGDDVVYLTSVMLAEAKAEMAIARSGNRSAFLEILTPEQQQKLEELRAEMKAFREERRKEFTMKRRDNNTSSPKQVF